MSDFWPFQKPEAPTEKLGLLGSLADWVKEFIDTVYWAGVAHGAMLASLVWIALLLIVAIVAVCLYYDKKRELAVGLVGMLIAIVLWYYNRLPAPSPRLPTPIIKPAPQPDKPWWRPFKKAPGELPEGGAV